MSELVEQAVARLDQWITGCGSVGYDPFDGLSAPWARRLTLEIPALRMVLQQTVRRLPVNIRPLLGISQKRSNQAQGYFAAGYLRRYACGGWPDDLDKARDCLADLQAHVSPGWAGPAWGWLFDYQSRGHYLPRGRPTVVWTAFIAHSFVEAYELLGDPAYLATARGACDFILKDLPRRQVTPRSLVISYVPGQQLEIHNANMLAASLLARVYQHTAEPELLAEARQAVRYTLDHQHPDGAWYYGEGRRWRWVDGYHTGFVLEALFDTMQSTGDDAHGSELRRGMDYYRRQLFDGPRPKHYSTATYPIDIQSAAQAIQTFAHIPPEFHGDRAWAEQVAGWTIAHMQAPAGCFYFRRHRRLTDRTIFLHWGQATMLAALSWLLPLSQAGLAVQEPV
ncbi:MAG: hypothetical protein ABI847_00805 [Anaerolineales bacterium]